MRLECGLDGQVGPKRRQVAFGMQIVALKCGPRGAKLRLEDGLEAKKGVLEGQLEKIWVGSLPTERGRWSAGGAGEGKEGASPSQTGINFTQLSNTPSTLSGYGEFNGYAGIPPTHLHEFFSLRNSRRGPQRLGGFG